jgi:hypothetical protein
MNYLIDKRDEHMPSSSHIEETTMIGKAIWTTIELAFLVLVLIIIW